MESFGSNANPIAEKEALLSFILFFRLTFTQSPTFTRSVSGMGCAPLATFATSSSKAKILASGLLIWIFRSKSTSMDSGAFALNFIDG